MIRTLLYVFVVIGTCAICCCNSKESISNESINDPEEEFTIILDDPKGGKHTITVDINNDKLVTTESKPLLDPSTLVADNKPIPVPNRIIKLVERISGLTFEYIPVVFVVSSDYINSHIRRDLLNSIHDIYVNIPESEKLSLLDKILETRRYAGLQLPGKIFICVPSDYESLSSEDIINTRTLCNALAHELTHAIIDQNYSYSDYYESSKDVELRSVLTIISESIAEYVSEEVCSEIGSFNESNLVSAIPVNKMFMSGLFTNHSSLEILETLIKAKCDSACRVFHLNSSIEPNSILKIKELLKNMRNIWPNYLICASGSGLFTIAKYIAFGINAGSEEQARECINLIKSLRHGTGIQLIHMDDKAVIYDPEYINKYRGCTLNIAYLDGPKYMELYIDIIVKGLMNKPNIEGINRSRIRCEGVISPERGQEINVIKRFVPLNDILDITKEGMLVENEMRELTVLWFRQDNIVAHAICFGMDKKEIQIMEKCVSDIKRIISAK